MDRAEWLDDDDWSLGETVVCLLLVMAYLGMVTAFFWPVLQLVVMADG